MDYLGNCRSDDTVTFVKPIFSQGLAPAGTYTLHSGLSGNYYGTVSAHLGYVMDNIQLFVSGGFAYAGNGSSGENTVTYTSIGGQTTSYTGGGSNQSHTRSVFGVGGEYAFGSTLAAGLEYEYVSLKNSNITLTDPNSGGQVYIVNDIKDKISVIRVGIIYSC